MKIKLFNFKIDDYTFEGAVNKAIELQNENKVSQIVTLNPEIIEMASKNENLATIIHDSEMVVPEGIGIKVALKINGYNVERIPGIDFAYRLLLEAGKRNTPVAVIGSKEEVIVKAVENLKKEINGLNIVFYHNGYFNDDEEIFKGLSENNPKLILVAMGAPRQEEFIYKAKSSLDGGLMIGIGGSLDVWSGMVKRAPKMFQKLGLEWLYRITTEPKRLKRVFPTLPLFVIKAFIYKYSKKEL